MPQLYTLPSLLSWASQGVRGKESVCNAEDTGDAGSIPELSGRSPARRKWQPTPVFSPGEYHGHRILVGYSLWGCNQLDMTECLHVCARVHAHTDTDTQTHTHTHTHTHTQPPLILTSAFLGPPSRKPCGVGKQAAGQKPRAVSGLGECGSGTN